MFDIKKEFNKRRGCRDSGVNQTECMSLTINDGGDVGVFS